MKKNKVILTHEMVRIVQTDAAYELHLCMQTGQWVEHEPFPGDQRGLVVAVSLAAEILAGKFWLRRLITKTEAIQAPATVLLEKKP